MPKINIVALDLPRIHPNYVHHIRSGAVAQLNLILYRIRLLDLKLTLLDPEAYKLFVLREYAIEQPTSPDSPFMRRRSVTKGFRRKMKQELAALVKHDPLLIIVAGSIQVQSPIADPSMVAREIYPLFGIHEHIYLAELKAAQHHVASKPEFRESLPVNYSDLSSDVWREEKLMLTSDEICQKLNLEMLCHKKAVAKAIKRLEVKPDCKIDKINNISYVFARGMNHEHYRRIDKRAPCREVPEPKDIASDDHHVIWSPPKLEHTSTKVTHSGGAARDNIEFEISTCRAICFNTDEKPSVRLQLIPSDTITFLPRQVHGDFVVQVDSTKKPILYTKLTREAIAAHPYKIILYMNLLLEDSLDLTEIPLYIEPATPPPAPGAGVEASDEGESTQLSRSKTMILEPEPYPLAMHFLASLPPPPPGDQELKSVAPPLPDHASSPRFFSQASSSSSSSPPTASALPLPVLTLIDPPTGGSHAAASTPSVLFPPSPSLPSLPDDDINTGIALENIAKVTLKRKREFK